MPAVHEPQPGLHPQDGLPDDREPEVSGFDQPGVHGPDRDLVDPAPLDLEEREGADVGVESRVGVGVAKHRVPAAGPVPVPEQSLRQRVPFGADAVEVADLALEPAGGVGDRGEAGDPRVVREAPGGPARLPGTGSGR